jgi:hypothetical protein
VDDHDGFGFNGGYVPWQGFGNCGAVEISLHCLISSIEFDGKRPDTTVWPFFLMRVFFDRIETQRKDNAISRAIDGSR